MNADGSGHQDLQRKDRGMAHRLDDAEVAWDGTYTAGSNCPKGQHIISILSFPRMPPRKPIL
jgi:hypothetical protein